MKKHILLAVIGLFFIPSLGFSQIDIIPTFGYNFGANVPIYGGELKVKGAETFGVNIDYNLGNDNFVQFSYTSTLSKITINDYYYPGGGISNGTFSEVSENYFLLGGVKNLSDGGPVIPYGSMSMGLAYYNFSNFDSYYNQYSQSDMTRFAVGFGLGAKIMFSEKIGIDLHVRALAPIQWGGIGIGIGTGGVSSGAYVGSSFISGDVGGGLIIRLGE